MEPGYIVREKQRGNPTLAPGEGSTKEHRSTIRKLPPVQENRQ